MKTWGENPIIQEIRDRLRILKKEAVYPWRVDYGSGYRSGIDDALKAIAKVMKNNALRKKKFKEQTLKKVVKAWNRVRKVTKGDI
jgi:hypothetical protein